MAKGKGKGGKKGGKGGKGRSENPGGDGGSKGAQLSLGQATKAAEKAADAAQDAAKAAQTAAKAAGNGGGGGGGKGKKGKKDKQAAPQGYVIRIKEKKGEDGKKHTTMSVGKLKKLSTKLGGRYLDLKSGRLLSAKSLRSKNPDLTAGEVVSGGVGVMGGVGMTELVHRIWVTRQNANGEPQGGHEGAWYGQQAALRILRRPGAGFLLVNTLTSAAWMGLGALAHKRLPKIGTFAGSYGMGKLAWVGTKVVVGFVVPMLGKVETGGEATFANRVAPEFATPVLDILDNEIEHDVNTAPLWDEQVERDGIDYTASEYPFNLTPYRLGPQGSSTTKGDGGDSGGTTTTDNGSGSTSTQTPDAASKSIETSKAKDGAAATSTAAGLGANQANVQRSLEELKKKRGTYIAPQVKAARAGLGAYNHFTESAAEGCGKPDCKGDCGTGDCHGAAASDPNGRQEAPAQPPAQNAGNGSNGATPSPPVANPDPPNGTPTNPAQPLGPLVNLEKKPDPLNLPLLPPPRQDPLIASLNQGTQAAYAQQSPWGPLPKRSFNQRSFRD